MTRPKESDNRLDEIILSAERALALADLRERWSQEEQRSLRHFA